MSDLLFKYYDLQGRTIIALIYHEGKIVYLKIAATPTIQHGEGPHWNPAEGVLYYVDTFKATIYRWDPRNNKVTSQKLEGRDSVGTITPIRNQKNKFIVTSDRYIYVLTWDGVHDNTGKFRELMRIEEDKPKNQFNDGKADANGNLWMGTLTREPDMSVSPKGGSLYRFIPCQNFSLKEKLQNVSISNGIAWSRDNREMFYIDSMERTVEKWKFDLSTGNMTNKEVLLDLSHYPDIKGIPDGMTIDENDNLYVAIYAGSCVLKINSITGNIMERIILPAKYPTSAVFGGPNLDILYVTTSVFKSTNNELKETPEAGAVFAVTGLRSKGLPLHEIAL